MKNQEQIIYKKIDEIKPYKNNPRINDEAVKYVTKSIKQYGFRNPIIIDKDNTIIAGHTRLKGAKKLGYKEVPCIIADDLSEADIKAFRLADNKVAEFSLWDNDLLDVELEDLFTNFDVDMSEFGFEGFNDYIKIENQTDIDEDEQLLAPSCQHNVFENQEKMQFPIENYYGIPTLKPTQTKGDKFLRFMDWGEVEDLSEYIAHFYYDDYKFMSAWREPDKYIDRLKQFKAVISPDFSLYTDFPLALQILSCYRRQWCGAYWQSLGIDIIPDVVWGEEKTFEFCFDGIPKHSTVAVSTVGVKNNKDWNGKESTLFVDGYNEMIKRLEPTTILIYGDMIDGINTDNIINIPSYYAERRERWSKNG